MALLHDIEPLAPEPWFSALERLALRQRTSGPQAIESMLRHGLHLVQLAPGPLKGIVRCETSEAAFEAMLEHGAFDAAAIALVSPPLSFEIGGTCVQGRRLVCACVNLTDSEDRGISASCNTVAGALVGAWASFLVELRRRSLAESEPPADPGPRTTPAEPHRKSIEP
jgi:hypothetical protein